MDANEARPAETCAWCRTVLIEDQWLALEVQRPVEVPDHGELVAYEFATFCTQEHAALWLAQPLSPPEPPTIVDDTSGSVWFWTGAWSFVIAAAGLASVGVWTIVQWIWR